MSLGMDSIKALACPFINHRSLNDANTANRGVVAKNCPADKLRHFAGHCSPEPVAAPSFRAVNLLVSDRTGRFVAVNVETRGKVRVLTRGRGLGDGLRIRADRSVIDRDFRGTPISGARGFCWTRVLLDTELWDTGCGTRCCGIQSCGTGVSAGHGQYHPR
jgi:hypothetical protein